jgi:hypothetical protein
MKKLIVCGCSFSAPAKDLPGTAYGEVLAKKLGWDVEILARQGCSNGGIRVQIDEAIRQKADFVIVSPTFHDRMEIPASAAPSKGASGMDLQAHLQNNDILNGYDRNAGIDNVNYGTNPYRMICETIFSLADNTNHPYRSSKIDKDTQNAVKQYINFMYDANWKKQQDEWIIRDGIIQLFFNGIPFLLASFNLWKPHEVRALFPRVIPDQCFVTNVEDTPAHATNLFPYKGEDPGYHGAPASQEYLADRYYNLIKNVWQL